MLLSNMIISYLAEVFPAKAWLGVICEENNILLLSYVDRL